MKIFILKHSYDSAEFEVPLEKAAEAIEIAMYYFNDFPQEIFPWLGICIGSECELGISWGETEVVHRGVTQQECEQIINKLKAKQ